MRQSVEKHGTGSSQLTIDSVMQQLEPMLVESEHQHTPCAVCGDTKPESFGVYASRCLSCRRDDDTARRMRLKQERDFQRSLETLQVINSFPPRVGG